MSFISLDHLCKSISSNLCLIMLTIPGRYFLQVTFHRSQLQVTQYLPQNSIKIVLKFFGVKRNCFISYRFRKSLVKSTSFRCRNCKKGFFHRSHSTGHRYSHSNCAPKRNMFLLKIYIRACLVLLALLSSDKKIN